MDFNPVYPHNLEMLPPKVALETPLILKALNSASREVGELKGYCASVPEPRVLMSAVITKEAVESSGIEAIITTVESVMESQVIPRSEQKPPEKETIRYREAVYWAMDNIERYFISTQLILGIHKKLLKTSFGYRKQQNAIKNQRTGEIIYSPPIASTIDQLMQNWENFVNLNDDSKLDPLIKCAIAHYQFEAIHPFSDGNGRTGRILLVLQMVQAKLLDYPVMYTSSYLNKNREQYYQNLKSVTDNGDWEGYILFMLEGFRSQAIESKLKLFKMMALFEKLKNTIHTNHSKMNAMETANHLFSGPVTTPTFFAKSMDMHYQTASKHLAELKKGGILSDSQFGKYHLYYYKELIDLINS